VGTSSTYDAEASNLVVASSGHTGITVASTGANQRTNLYFADGTSGTALFVGGFTYDHNDNSLLTRTSGIERMRIDSSGRLLVGASSTAYANTALTLSTDNSTKWSVGPYPGQSGQFYVSAGSGTGVYIANTTATSWSSNSDERLKTDLLKIENAFEKVSTLRAVTGRYKTDPEGFSRAFLLAQDVQQVLPEAVTESSLPGLSDDQKYLSLAYTEVIPLLVAALKESKERIETLETKVATLEAS
jgi:hypothetical protein